MKAFASVEMQLTHWSGVDLTEEGFTGTPAVHIVTTAEIIGRIKDLLCENDFLHLHLRYLIKNPNTSLHEILADTPALSTIVWMRIWIGKLAF